MRSILEYLERTGERLPDRIAVDDDRRQISYETLIGEGKAIGSALATLGIIKKPVAVFLPKSCECVAAFMGVAYSGGFYCPIDVAMPTERVEHIFGVLQPAAIITNSKYSSIIENMGISCELLLFDELINKQVDYEVLTQIRQDALDTDPLYAIFTSGSTGIPKGVLISHKSVIDFMSCLDNGKFVQEDDVIGNQGNLYFDLSVYDLYGAIATGATVVFIPKRKFLFPVDLIKYLNEKRITQINWVPSAIVNVANLKALEVVLPSYLKKVVFCGEIMPNKQLNIWKKALPEVEYINFYGPTEIVYACTYFRVDREFRDDESLPIGNPFENTRILVLNEQNELVSDGEAGELCVAGTCLALGYYNNPNKTKEVFVQNPLNTAYEEKIYRTGDLVKYNEYGELMYLSRKDFQIKHLGHRIELGEIETATGDIQEIENCACVYNDDEQEIVMCYTGTKMNPHTISDHLKAKIPFYMIPGRYIFYENMPYNINGKIDRLELKKGILAKG